MARDETPDESPSPKPWESEDEWLPAGAVESMSLEKAAHPDENEEATARRLFRENAPTAALAIIHMALHSPNERVRLDAAKYTVERVLGRVGDDAFGAEESPLSSFLKGVEQMANTGNNKK